VSKIMTRFARANQQTQKKPHEATPWNELKPSSSTASDNGVGKTKKTDKSLNKKNQGMVGKNPPPKKHGIRGVTEKVRAAAAAEVAR